jgi:hypothetical protein
MFHCLKNIISSTARCLEGNTMWYPEVPEIRLPEIKQLSKFLFTSISFEVAPSALIQQSQQDFHDRKHCSSYFVSAS